MQPCSKETILPLWDAYLVASDSFFVFFMALVMLVNARDLVFQMGEDNPEELVRVLATMPEVYLGGGVTLSGLFFLLIHFSLPSPSPPPAFAHEQQLEASDIPDMCDLAMHYASITPHAFRSEYGHHLFAGAKRPARPGHSALKRKDVSAESAKNRLVGQLLHCVSLLPLILLLDNHPSVYLTPPAACSAHCACRCLWTACCEGPRWPSSTLWSTQGRLHNLMPATYHTAGTSTRSWCVFSEGWAPDRPVVRNPKHPLPAPCKMLSAPKVFADEVARLQDALEASMHHPCFLGSGREEEDQYQRMLVAHFLNNKQKYVSIVQGGYEGEPCDWARRQPLSLTLPNPCTPRLALCAGQPVFDHERAGCAQPKRLSGVCGAGGGCAGGCRARGGGCTSPSQGRLGRQAAGSCHAAQQLVERGQGRQGGCRPRQEAGSGRRSGDSGGG